MTKADMFYPAGAILIYAADRFWLHAVELLFLPEYFSSAASGVSSAVSESNSDTAEFNPVMAGFYPDPSEINSAVPEFNPAVSEINSAMAGFSSDVSEFNSAASGSNSDSSGFDPGVAGVHSDTPQVN